MYFFFQDEQYSASQGGRSSLTLNFPLSKEKSLQKNFFFLHMEEKCWQE